MDKSIRRDLAVRDFIREGIVAGDYRPGGKLPTERALSERLGVPRSSVRDALAVLESAGQVVRIIGSGTYVREPDMPPVTGRPPDSSPAEIMEARLLLEPRLAQLAAVNADAADFARFETCIHEGDAADGFEAFERWDAALHEAIARATHNRLVVELYGMVTRARDQTEWGELKRRSLDAERREHYRREHRTVVAALRDRDAAAAEEALVAHLRRVRHNLLGV